MKTSSRHSAYTAFFLLTGLFLVSDYAKAGLGLNDEVSIYLTGGSHMVMEWQLDNLDEYGQRISSTVHIQHSADNGKTWSTPMEILSVSIPQYRLGEVDIDNLNPILNRPHRVVATFGLQDLINNKVLLVTKVSNDHGATWQEGWNVALEEEGEGIGCPGLNTIVKNDVGRTILYLETSIRKNATSSSNIFLAMSSDGISWTSQKIAELPPYTCEE